MTSAQLFKKNSQKPNQLPSWVEQTRKIQSRQPSAMSCLGKEIPMIGTANTSPSPLSMHSISKEPSKRAIVPRKAVLTKRSTAALGKEVFANEVAMRCIKHFLPKFKSQQMERMNKTTWKQSMGKIKGDSPVGKWNRGFTAISEQSDMHMSINFGSETEMDNQSCPDNNALV